MINIHDFVKQLRLIHVFTQKQSIVIDNLYIYFNDLKVYKVIVAINPDMRKKARRLGLSNDYHTTFFDDIPITIDGDYADKNNWPNINTGRYIAIYNPNSGKCVVYPGEESEEEQLRGLL